MLELHSARYGESVLESSALICSDIGLSTELRRLALKYWNGIQHTYMYI